MVDMLLSKYGTTADKIYQFKPPTFETNSTHGLESAPNFENMLAFHQWD